MPDLKLFEERFDRVDKNLARLERLLTGDERPENGIIVRLDRVEQEQKVHGWTLRAIIGALITSVLGFFAHR